MIKTEEPKNYQQWMECLEYLSRKPVSDEFVSKLKGGSCPGIESVMPQFLERIQGTVNHMLNRCSKTCTASLSDFLEEGDFSNMEQVLYRSYRDMKRCRFYLNIGFIPQVYVQELDEKTVSEIRRYWRELGRAMEDLAEESGSEYVYDTLYWIRRLINKDMRNGQL